MQKVGAFLLERREGVETPAKRRAEIQRLVTVLHDWLKAKKVTDPSAPSGNFHTRTGDATFRWDHAEADERSWRLLRVDEESKRGERFTTAVSLTDTGRTVAVYVSLEAGRAASSIRPLRVDPRGPQFVRSMIDLSGDWFHGPTKILKPSRLTGVDSGTWIAQQITDPTRTIPIVLISQDGDELALPALDEAIGHDLAGLANVFVLDEDASWGLSDALGRVWSCYRGAVRVYWPDVDLDGDPYRHSVWLAQSLGSGDEDSSRACDRFRSQLRKLLMGVAAVSVLRPREIDQIRTAASQHQLNDLRAKAGSGEELAQMAMDYASACEEDNKRLREEVERLTDELDEMQTRLANAEAMASYEQGETGEFEPEKPLPPKTVREAYERARHDFPDELEFGDDVAVGIEGLAEDAAPDKIFHHLSRLAALARAQKQGRLGTTIPKWLRERSVPCSQESDRVENDSSEMAKRTWHDGASRRKFTLHTKPKDGSNPAYCSRIYFDWDDDRKKVVIGWIGRHP